MRCVAVLTLCILSCGFCQHIHSGNDNHQESLLLSNEYYRQPYRTPWDQKQNEQAHHERDILRTAYEPLRQYESERYRQRPSQLRTYEDAGHPADYFRDPFGRPLANEGLARSQYLAVGFRPGQSAQIREATEHGYDDSTPYHTSGNRFFTKIDGQANYRNFDINGGANNARYTVRTGSDPGAQDGPIVAFASSPTRGTPGKLYVRDVPIYF